MQISAAAVHDVYDESFGSFHKHAGIQDKC